MSLRSAVRRTLAALCASAAGGLVLLVPPPAQAAPTATVAAPAGASGTVVRGLAFPGDAGFAYAGCPSWDGGTAPRAVVRDIPGSPLGNRSTGFSTAPGTGAGPQSAVPSLKDLGAMDIGVWSASGVSGLAYAWLFPSNGRAYLGTVAVSSGAGWGTSTATDKAFTWTERDPDTFAPVAGSTRGGTFSLQRAASRLGNGPARVGFAFGCGGEDFSLDRFRVGTRVLDFEGISVLTSMSRAPRTADGRTVLVGRSAGAGRETGEPLVLQRSLRGAAFRDLPGARVDVDVAGVHRATVKPGVASRYRWRRLEVPYADGGFSRSIVVEGQGAVSEGKERLRPGRPEKSAPREDEPTEPPSEEPTEPSVPDPTEPPLTEPTEPPSEEPTEPGVPDPTEPPVEEPSPEPTPEPTPDPTPQPVACEGLTYEDTAVWLESEGLEAADIESPLDADCPTPEELDALSTELGLELGLLPGAQG